VLDHLLSVDFDGVTELRDQAKDATVTGRCECGCPSVDLAVGPTASRSSLPRRLSPVEGRVAPVGEEPPGDIILFVDGGQLSRLECDAAPPSMAHTARAPRRCSRISGHARATGDGPAVHPR
jgi:hypothetical protein